MVIKRFIAVIITVLILLFGVLFVGCDDIPTDLITPDTDIESNEIPGDDEKEEIGTGENNQTDGQSDDENGGDENQDDNQPVWTPYL